MFLLQASKNNTTGVANTPVKARLMKLLADEEFISRELMGRINK